VRGRLRHPLSEFRRLARPRHRVILGSAARVHRPLPRSKRSRNSKASREMADLLASWELPQGDGEALTALARRPSRQSGDGIGSLRNSAIDPQASLRARAATKKQNPRLPAGNLEEWGGANDFSIPASDFGRPTPRCLDRRQGQAAPGPVTDRATCARGGLFHQPPTKALVATARACRSRHRATPSFESKRFLGDATSRSSWPRTATASPLDLVEAPTATAAVRSTSTSHPVDVAHLVLKQITTLANHAAAGRR